GATVESSPMVVSHFNVPETGGNFCARGGRFGSPSANESMASFFYQKVAFASWFNGGVRAIDIRDPYEPKEAGYFIPAITETPEKGCINISGEQGLRTGIQHKNHAR